ncbi:b-box zinc finger protein [Cyclospora cayetanensis]|uniref:B-box zinc finger protein n=1 Tax=Cyclospora cayetanensis TaxID=88456 RepID=A0A1D3CTJ3_9EIME|nr:b-box zinc finger protein [Cyclospora cayetanensis]
MESRRLSPFAVERPPQTRVKAFHAAMAAAGAPKDPSKQAIQNDVDVKHLQKPKGRLEKPPGRSNSPSLQPPAEGEDGELSEVAPASDAEEKIPVQLGIDNVACCCCSHGAADLLLLQCSHLLCLPCGSRELQHQAATDPAAGLGIIICPLCNTNTLLSSKAAATLIRARPKRIHPRERGNAIDANAEWAASEAPEPADTQEVTQDKEVTRVSRDEVPRWASPTASTLAAVAQRGSVSPRDLLTPPYLDASHIEWPLLCSSCEEKSASVYCRDCVRAFCRACAVEAHAPQGVVEWSFASVCCVYKQDVLAPPPLECLATDFLFCLPAVSLESSP